jgi:hypothetical protein
MNFESISRDELRTSRSISKYKIIIDSKGHEILKPVYLVTTPDDEIKRQNQLFEEWKTTKQVQYDINGIKISRR